MAARVHDDPRNAAPASPAGAARVMRADGAAVCERCTLADSFFPRLRGLLGRASLPAGEGILLAPCGSVHTWFLRFPIDVVFLDRDLRVLRLVGRMGPWRMARAKGAKKVLELAAGQAQARGIQAGERLALESAPR